MSVMNTLKKYNGFKNNFFTIHYYLLLLPPEIRVGELKVKSEEVIGKK